MADPETIIEYNRDGDFGEFTNPDGAPMIADVGILVLAEEPYAEGVGDKADISLTDDELMLLETMKSQSKSQVVILLSGRPRVITDGIPLADAWVAAWLPGTEGAGIADVLFGDYPFTGKTPYTWPRSLDQLPINKNNSNGKSGCDAPLFPFGYGLKYGDVSTDIPNCE
jgi:beta-glucosidase